MNATAFNEDAFRWSYALCKQLTSAYAITSDYGEIGLDEELRTAVEGVVRPILQRRLAAAENKPAPAPTPADEGAELLAALGLTLTTGDLRRLRRVAEERYQGDLMWTLTEIVEAALDELAGEG